MRADRRTADAAGPRLRARLRSVRVRARAVLAVRSFSLVIGWAILAIGTLALADFVLRTPDWLRMALWVFGVIALGLTIRGFALPSVRFRPSLTEVALRIERTDAGRRAGLEDLLASGLELSGRRGMDGESGGGDLGGLEDSVARRALERLSPIGATKVVAQRQAVPGVLVAALAIALGSAALAMRPELSRIGLSRIVLPWSGAAWPKRTGVADAMSSDVHPIGSALPLRAVLTRSPHAPGQTRVEAFYRLIGSDGPGPTQRVELTSQRRQGVTGDGSIGEFYERLIDPIAPGASSGSVATEREVWLEYWFQTEDDRTEPGRVLLVEPPAVVDAVVDVEPPEYTRSASGGAWIVGERAVGPGGDERAVVGPILAGSRVGFDVRFNKPMPVPAHPGEDWIARALGGAQLGEAFTIRADAQTWALSWRAGESARVRIAATDRHGLVSDRAEYQFDAVQDAPPSVSVTEPSDDESVLATAVIEASGEARDDVGVASIVLERRLARAPAGSIGAPPQATVPAAPIARLEPDPMPPTARVSASVDLATLGLHPGDELWLSARAEDGFDLLGTRHDPVESSVRRLRVISESDLIDQVRGELSGVRRSAIRVDQRQGELIQRVQDGPEPSGARQIRAAQDSLTDRLARQRATIDRLRGRVERNGLRDEALDGLLDDSGQLLDRAAQSSASARDELEQSIGESGEGGVDRGALERARVAQDQVRKDLERLVELLDRGEDGWVIRRSLERLAQDQRALSEQTDRTTRDTLGRARDQLSDEQRTSLDRIAQQQRQISQRARQALDTLSQRSRQLAQSDPSASAGMAEAARSGRQSEVPEKLDEAAEQVQANRGASATRLQQQALNAIEQMLGDLASGAQRRDEILQRVLADLVQSIEGLIDDQQRQISSLERIRQANGDGGRGGGGLDSGMIALHRNTLGVADLIHPGMPEVEKVQGMLQSAGRSQASAVVALRADALDLEGAERHERNSLGLLEQARDEARRLGDQASQRDAQRKRAMLQQAYRESLEEQVVLRGGTGEYLGEELTRRQRASVRGLGQKQDALRQRLDDLREQTDALSQAATFIYAHKTLDRLMSSAADRLGRGLADSTVIASQDRAIKTLSALVRSLTDPPKEDDFRDSQAGGASGGGGGGAGGQTPVIPSVAELRMLRAMQTEAADLTRQTDDGATDPDLLGEVSRLQRDLAELGRVLLKKMEGGPDTPEGPAPVDPGAGPLGYAWAAVAGSASDEPPPSGTAPPAPPEKESAPERDDRALPGLDELLGLSGEGADRPDSALPTPDPSRADLERRLSPEEAADEFAQAVALMEETADRLGGPRDTSLATQRLQRRILRKLDSIIKAANRQQGSSSQRQSGSRSGSEPRSQPKQSQSRSASRPGSGDNRGQVNPPGRRDGPLAPGVAPDSAAWGNLPDRQRQSLLQGSSERYSALYRLLTEAYYRRLAQEARR